MFFVRVAGSSATRDQRVPRSRAGPVHCLPLPAVLVPTFPVSFLPFVLLSFFFLKTWLCFMQAPESASGDAVMGSDRYPVQPAAFVIRLSNLTLNT